MSTPYRISRFVLFVPWDAEVEVRDTASERSWRVREDEAARLRERYAGFADLLPGDERWVERQILVPPGADATRVPEVGSEAALAKEVEAWYWRHEVESERGYTWLGWPIVKSPPDIFFYQELIGSRGIRRILELGSGDGGGLWMFASFLEVYGGGLVVGVERDPPKILPPFERFSRVDVHQVVGDAFAAETSSTVGLVSGTFDLIVIDVGAQLVQQLEALDRWSRLVARNGLVVMEDASGTPGLWPAMDDRLVHIRGLSVLSSSHIPYLKSGGAVLQCAAGIGDHEQENRS